MHASVVSFLFFCFSAATAAQHYEQRIMGGSLTTIDKYPDIVCLLNRQTSGHNFQQACGGAVLNERSILSAAHCFRSVTAAHNWHVRAGSSFVFTEGQIRYPSTIIRHPQFNSQTADNDVAVLRLSNNLVFSNTLRAARIAGTNYNVRDNDALWVAGWGRQNIGGTYSRQLRHVQIYAVNQAICRRNYAERGNTVTDNMMCSGIIDVGGRDACQGDSGGPIYHNGVVVGVVSWGHLCGQPRFPGVSARVSRYTNWITSNA